MDKDYYKILGVTPTSEDVVIRAAYRALMRRYHPDADQSDEAAGRAREINEAYSVLSDPEKRSRYDDSAALSVVSLEPQSEFSPERRPRRSLLAPAAGIGFAVLAAGMVALALSPAEMRLRFLGFPPGEVSSVEPDEAVVAQPAKVAARRPETLCADPDVQRLIRDELLRQAGLSRPGAQKSLNAVASGARIRVHSPLSAGGTGGGLGCKGWLVLDLPEGVVVEQGRTNLNAEIAYQLARRSDGKVALAGLTGINAVLRSLQTAAPPPREPEAIEKPAPVPVAQREVSRPVQKVARATAVPPARSASAQRPLPPQQSGDCSAEGSPAARLNCSNSNLASLDRQLASFYRQSWDKADETKRAALLGSRQRFNERRSACGSSSCVTGAYVARLKEISDIMAGRTPR